MEYDTSIIILGKDCRGTSSAVSGFRPAQKHSGTLKNVLKNAQQRAPTMEQFGKPTRNSIPTIVRLFKSSATKRINEFRNTPGTPVWQRNYYEHVIRGEKDFDTIREYIMNSPSKWQYDRDNTDRISNIQTKK